MLGSGRHATNACPKAQGAGRENTHTQQVRWHSFPDLAVLVRYLHGMHAGK